MQSELKPPLSGVKPQRTPTIQRPKSSSVFCQSDNHGSRVHCPRDDYVDLQ